ncbi:MAG: hypothetical protein M3490_07580 [Chloroflexota bacterium]|nr:hypothetical protein [Chloroflexota bacterium]
MLQQFAGGLGIDDLPVVHDGGAIGHLHDCAEVVADDQHREAEPLLQFLEVLEDRALDHVVESRRRFVEQHE